MLHEKDLRDHATEIRHESLSQDNHATEIRHKSLSRGYVS